MNIDAIRKTAVCYWSDEDNSYVVESSLFDSLAGTGDTLIEAMQSFEDMLSDALESFHKGRVPKDKSGRPSKNIVALNTDVKPETRKMIVDMSKDFGCSQGEIIDYLALYVSKINDEGHQTHEDEERLGMSQTVYLLMKNLEDLMKQLKVQSKLAKKKKAREAKGQEPTARRKA